MTPPNVQVAISKPDRRRFQYSLAGLLGFTTFVAVVLSLLRSLYVTGGLDLVGSVILAVIVGGLYVICIAWAVGDARKRGQSGVLVVAFFASLGPFAAVLWLLVRPSVKPVIRSAMVCSNPEDALAAAFQLDIAGDWDAAVVLYGEVARHWPEHEPYARGRVTEIELKQSRAEER
jgi:hypothetical protein